jgi:hypothetical protein
MDETTYKRLKTWIFENHTHHGTIDEHTVDSDEWSRIDDDTICDEGDYPYVNSLALEGYLDSLVDPTWAASYQYKGDKYGD